MSNHNPSLEDRLSHSSEAKKQLLAKFRKFQDADDPAIVEKRQQRAGIVAARTERARHREQARQDHEQELARQSVLAAEAAAKAKREADELAVREAAEQADREAALKAEQKAARDVRYAARKAAKKERRRGY